MPAEQRDQFVFYIVRDLLSTAPIPADLRAALYRVAARIPGMRPVGEIRDAAGRPGVGVAFDPGTSFLQHILIFDPATGELLGTRDGPAKASIGKGDPGGTFFDEVAYLEDGVADKVGQRP